MSFTPGENGGTPGVAGVASDIGSGISVQPINNVDYVSVNLVAGANISLVPSVVDSSITISSSGGGGGIASVSSTAGSGINTTLLLPATIELSSALVAGSNISLTPGSGKNLIINNTATLSTNNGSGISITPSGSSNTIATNLVAGTGISLQPSGTSTALTINNNGVLGLNAGSNVTITPNGSGQFTIGASDVSYTAGTGLSLTSNVFANTGVLSVATGTGLSNSGTSSNPTLVNTGVTQLSNSDGYIGLSGSNGFITLANNGVRTIQAGTNIVLTGTPNNPIISAIDTIGSITGGTGITVNTVGANVSVANAGVLTVTTPAGNGLSNIGTAQNPSLVNTGVIQLNAGSNITITGTTQNPIITANAGTTYVGGTGISVAGNTINNTGVLGITSTVPGINIGGTAQNPTLTFNGVFQVNVAPNSGLALSGSTALPVLSNTGVLSITAGSNITITGTSQNPVINATIPGVQIQVSGTAQSPIISAVQQYANLIIGGDVAGGILRSADNGNTWTYNTPPWVLNQQWGYGGGTPTGCIWDGTNFVLSLFAFNAPANAQCVCFCPDGLTWQRASYTGMQFLTGIAYGNGRYVVIGQDNGSGQGDRVATTTNINGTWIGTNSATLSNLLPESCCFFNNLFWITGTAQANQAIFSSPDGQNWTAVPFGPSTQYVGNSSIWVNNGVMYFYESETQVQYQWNGTAFVTTPQSPPTQLGYSVSYANNGRTYYVSDVGGQAFDISIQTGAANSSNGIFGYGGYGYTTGAGWVGNKLLITGSNIWVDNGDGNITQLNGVPNAGSFQGNWVTGAF